MESANLMMCQERMMAHHQEICMWYFTSQIQLTNQSNKISRGKSVKIKYHGRIVALLCRCMVSTAVFTYPGSLSRYIHAQ